jgi:hypothetical protein
LELIVEEASPHDEDLIRVCVRQVLAVEQALGAGGLAVPGLPPAGDLLVEVQRLDRESGQADGSAGPVALSDDSPREVVPWQACGPAGCAPCVAGRESAGQRQEDRLLVVWFEPEGHHPP